MSKEIYGNHEAFSFENDPIVIRVFGKSIINGRKLDVTGYTGEYIRKGQLILRDTSDTHSIPMPLNEAGTAYAAKPEGYEYEGVSKSTVSVKEPWVGVMYEGEVNDVASPFPLSAELLTALKSALPELAFKHS